MGHLYGLLRDHRDAEPFIKSTVENMQINLYIIQRDSWMVFNLVETDQIFKSERELNIKRNVYLGG